MTTNWDAGAVELVAMVSAWRALTMEWDLSRAERLALLPAGGEDVLPPPADTEMRMRILIEIGYGLRFPDSAALQGWLRSPLSAFREATPLEVMSGRLGDLRTFRHFVEQGAGS